MKPSLSNRIFALAPLFALGFTTAAPAVDLFWDANGATTTATGGTGNWGTASTWRSGSSTGTLQSWSAGETAVFGGTAGTLTLGTGFSANQLRFLTTGYTIGAVAAGPITFVGSYGDTAPTIDSSSISGNSSTSIQAKLTGTLDGGLVIKDGNNIATPATSGRVYLNSGSGSDFIGDITVLSGNLHVLSNLGNAANDIILKGGALFGSSGGAVTYNVNRNLVVVSNSAIGTNATIAGVNMDLAAGKTITGAGNLTRYIGGSQGAVAEVRLLGDMSGYTGTFENRGGVVVAQTAATSGGGWKLTGGTLKLNAANSIGSFSDTASNANPLLMNGGTLDLNGHSETINGLDGATGTVQNALASTAATLTVGDGDATANFGGTLRDNAGTGGLLALTKMGDGIQTLGGISSYTGATLVSAGTLLVTGQLGATAVTVSPGAMIGGNGTLGGNLLFEAGAKMLFSTTQTLTVTGATSFGGFGIADLVGLDQTVANGTYTLIAGSVSMGNIDGVGLENAVLLGGDKYAYLQAGSLQVVVIPEPTAVLLGSLGMIALLRRRRA